MGTLKVNRITGITGVTGQEPIVMSGDTVSLGNNSMSINGTGVTMTHNASFPPGTIITHTQYSSTTGQDYSGTTEAVYTSIGNPIVFVKVGVPGHYTMALIYLKERRIELHIFNFNSLIYGKTLKIKLITKIRDEIRFSSIEKLKEQLKKDEIQSIKILRNEKI